MTAARADLEIDDLDDLDVPDDTPEPERWEPDAHLIDSVLASPKAWRGMLKQPEPDRSLLVAGLTLSGLTAKQIADRTTCSLRLIRFIRAKDMTQVCVWALEQTAALENELYQQRSQNVLLRQQLEEVQRREQRLQTQFDQMITSVVRKQPPPVCLNNHPLVGDNVYRHVDSSGLARDFCRQCNRDRAARYRARRKKSAQVKPRNHTNRVTLQSIPMASGS